MVKLLKFVAIGGMATLLQFILLALFVDAEWVAATPASAISYMISAVFNYLANYYFTFASTQKHSSTLPKFLVTAGLGVVINTLLFKLSLAALETFIAQHPWLSDRVQQLADIGSTGTLTIVSLAAQVFATFVTLIVNFGLHKYWIYRR